MQYLPKTVKNLFGITRIIMKWNPLNASAFTKSQAAKRMDPTTPELTSQYGWNIRPCLPCHGFSSTFL
jgi:hypothetical protein